MTKRYFSASHAGRIFFRASPTMHYRALTLHRNGDVGFSQKEGGGPAVIEITKGDYDVLARLKMERVTAAWQARNPGKPMPTWKGTSPEHSWIEMAAWDAFMARTAEVV